MVFCHCVEGSLLVGGLRVDFPLCTRECRITSAVFRYNSLDGLGGDWLVGSPYSRHQVYVGAREKAVLGLRYMPPYNRIDTTREALCYSSVIRRRKFHVDSLVHCEAESCNSL